MHTPRRFAVVLISGLIAASSLAIAPPASANGCIVANFPSGDGSAGSPFEIATGNNLAYVASDDGCFGYHYRQTADITLPSAITPIGDLANPFTKTYDGGGFTISNLTITSGTDDVGLFGYINGATITGVNITSGSVTGRNYVGGLVGRSDNSTITNSSSSASISGVQYVGGLIGLIGSTGSHRVSSSFASGTVNASTANYVGGLVGGTSNMTIADVYSTSPVSGANQVGGIIGEYDSSSLIRAYSVGLVTGTGVSIGGVVGMDNLNNTTSNVTWDVDTTGKPDWGGPSDPDVIGNTTAAMKSMPTFRDLGWSIGSLWTGNTTWVICPQANNGYPFLSAFYTAQTAPCINRSGPPPDVEQQVGRTAGQDCATAGNAELNIGGVASGGWGQSWAQWMNGGTGGFVCNRTLYYNVQYGRWEVRT